MRVGAGDHHAGHHETLLGEVEVEDAVAGRGVVRLLDAVERGERAADRGLLVVGLDAGEDEMIVRDRDLPRPDHVAAGDLVEGVDRERRGAVAGRQQIGVDAQRGAGPHLGALVDAMRPQDLLAGREPARGRRIGPLDLGLGLDAGAELAAADGEDAAAPADLVFLRRQRDRIVGLPARDVREPARVGIERECVAFLGVGHGLEALHHVEAEIEGVAPEDVAHVVSAHDHHLEADLLGHALEAGGAHLARRSDREAVAGDQEVLAAVHARAEVGHQVAERAGLPALVERLEALGHAVGGGRDLVGVDGIELLPRDFRVPEDQRLAADETSVESGFVSGVGGGKAIERHAGLEARGVDGIHEDDASTMDRR